MKNFLSIFCLLTSFLYSKEDHHKLAICAIFQNDAKYLPEWVEFHHKQGVTKFFLYENLSEDDFMYYLKPYIESNLITLIPWHKKSNGSQEWNAVQCSAYMDCVKKNRYTCEWIAFLDTDEFLFSPSKASLPDVLGLYDGYSGLSVNWVIYGCNGVEKLKEGEKLTKNLTMRSHFDEEANKHVKSIIRPTHVLNCVNPHFFFLKKGNMCVTEDYEAHYGHMSKRNSVSVLRINHYWQRDLDFFYNVKMKRQKKWGNFIEEQMNEFKNCFNDVYDPILLDF